MSGNTAGYQRHNMVPTFQKLTVEVRDRLINKELNTEDMCS